MARLGRLGSLLILAAACGGRTPIDDTLDWADGGSGASLGTGGSKGTGGYKTTGGSYGTGGYRNTGGYWGAGGSTYWGTGGYWGAGGSTYWATGGSTYWGAGGSTYWGAGGSTYWGTGGYYYGTGGSTATYPIAQPGKGLIDVLPMVNQTPKCDACVQTRCPEAVKCSYDPACSQQMSCVMNACVLLAQPDACVLSCIGSNFGSAQLGVTGVTCVYQTCTTQCVGPGR